MGEDFALARLFYTLLQLNRGRWEGTKNGGVDAAGREFDRLTYDERVAYNDALRAVFRKAEQEPELARGLR